MSTGPKSRSGRLAGILLLGTALSFPSLAYAQDTQGVPPGDDPSTKDTAIEGERQIDPVADTSDAPDSEKQDSEKQASDRRDSDRQDQGDEADVSIPGGNRVVITGRRTVDVSRDSGQVLSVLTADDIARTGDGDVASALTRVTGLSQVGDGRVFVRGLGDRYSLALLNGLPLPSPEPLSRVVPLDIFPTSVIASTLVQKTYSANFPGEFGGGVINLTTRAVPTESFLSISASGGIDTETNFSNGLTYYGSDWDKFGFDNGNRDIPSNLQAFLDSGERIDSTSIATQEGIAAQLFPTNLVTLQRMDELPANWSFGVTAGTSFEVGGGNYLGVIATANISNSWRNRNVHSQAANTDLTELTDDFTTFITDNNVLVNGMLSFGLDIGEHTIRWTNLYIRDTLKTARLEQGTQFDKGATGFDFQNQNTAWFERQLIDSQLVGEFDFDVIDIDARVGFAQTEREAPFNTTFSYTRTNVPDSTADTIDSIGENFAVYLNRASDTGLTRVSFDDLTEKLWYAGLDVSAPVTGTLTLTAGTAFSDTDRVSTRREFLPRAEVSPLELVDPNSGATYTFTPDPQLIPIIGLRRPGDIINGASLALFDIRLDEASPFPKFDAALEIIAGYGIATWAPIDTISVEAGVRYETAKQTVELDQSVFSTPISGATSTKLDNKYFLPGATITWSPTDDLQLRVAASKTIARPQFRELVEQTYFDPESNRTYRGNPFLTDSELFNAEARVEYYMSGGDKITLAGFYKKIDKPIEAFITSSAGGGLITSYANAPEAQLYGAEFDVQYTIDLIGLGDMFATRRFVLRGNYTYTQSDIGVESGDLTFLPPGGAIDASVVFDDGDRMVGQSDHLANVQLSFEDSESLSQFSVLLSYASERVTSRGFQRPDVIEDPGLTLDFVARQEVALFGSMVDLEFEVRNITGRGNFEYQQLGGNRIDVNTYERGTRFSLGAKIEF